MLKKFSLVVSLAVFLTLCLLFSNSALTNNTSKDINGIDGEKNLALLVGENNLNSYHALALKASTLSLEKLGIQDKENLLVITNSGYAKINDIHSSPCLDAIAASTGCTQGKGNLLTVISTSNSPLYFFFFNNEDGNAVYLEVNSESLNLFSDLTDFEGIIDKEENDLFTRISLENIKASTILGNPNEWNQKVINKIFGGNEFSLVSISNLWAEKAPEELIRASQFHNHLCPGVTVGYLLANYLTKNLPLSDSDGQSYYIISSPAWCKDDALQIMLNTTVGKQGMVVVPLSDSDKKLLSPEAKNATGIYFRYDQNTKEGKAVVLGFDFDRLCTDSGISFDKGFSWEYCLKCDLWINEHSKDCMKYITVIKEFELENGITPMDYAHAGVNPWQKINLWQNK